MIRQVSVGHALTAVATLAILTACTGPATTGDSTDGTTPSLAPTSIPTGPASPSPSPGPFDPNEPVLPGGVRVLSEVYDAVSVPAGRVAVRLSPSALLQVDVPDDSQAWGGRVLITPAGSLLVSDAPRKTTGVPAHPCTDHTHSVIGPTVRDLATALSRQQFFETTQPVPVTLAGAKGMLVQLTFPPDVLADACDDGEAQLFSLTGPEDNWTANGPGKVYRLWVLTVAGKRYVVMANHPATPAKAAALTRMVESITFTRS